MDNENMDDDVFWSDGAIQTAGTDMNLRQQITELHVGFGPTLNEVNEMVINNGEVENSASHTNKKRKLKSKVWDEFTKSEEVNGKEWAVCNHCNRKFDGSSKKGTTHLKNHLDRCKTKTSNPGGTSAADKTKRSNPGGSSAADKTGDCLTTTTMSTPANIIIQGKSKVGEELTRLDNTRMIIKNWGVTLESIAGDLFEVFEEEKLKLMRYFEKLPCRFNLSIKWLGYSDYFYVSVHFIDDNWELKKKVIYVEIKEDESYEGLLKRIAEEWNIDKKICSIVDDNEPSVVDEWDSESGSLPFAGIFPPLSHLLELYPCWIRHTEFMRRTAGLKKYVLSNGNNNLFEKAVDNAAAANSISMLVNTKQNAQSLSDLINLYDFELLEWAVALKEVFWELGRRDPMGFGPCNLTKDEWDDATAFYKPWKEVRDAVNSLCGCKCKTPNVYFPKICHLQTKLLQWRQKDDNDSIREHASFCRNYFDDYWTISNLVFTTSVILDPRFKLDIVKCWYKEIYDNRDINKHLKEMIDKITNIYDEYAKAIENSRTSAMLDPMGRPCTSVCHVDGTTSIPSELDRYLEDPKFLAIEEFDILAWWNLNSPIYPTLARMARDYLAIPICVENCLSSSLLDEINQIIIKREDREDDITEALVHTKIWLYGS